MMHSAMKASGSTAGMPKMLQPIMPSMQAIMCNICAARAKACCAECGR